MIIYTDKITPRLRYITEFIGKEIIGKPFELTEDKDFFEKQEGPKINYSAIPAANCKLQITNAPLLFEQGIVKQQVSCFTINGFKAFFKTQGDYPFDIFAATFYLISRYEEYLPHQKDIYGRYAHENALAYQEGFLHLPLVEIWIEDFKRVLNEKFSTLSTHHSPFTFLPTYDIDEAYAYRYKGLIRTAGGLAKSLLGGRWSVVKERMNVLSGKEPDPFDAFAWMDKIHAARNLKPFYFFHVAERNGKYDKNILPSHPAMRELIKYHAGKYDTGIHPSWQSGDEEKLLQKEIQLLEETTGKKITSSRQHYIRFSLPHTFRQLIAAGIKDDYSMGYGSINGFRASITNSFYWYDLEKEEKTNLLLHPFCYMDANSFYEQKLTAAAALEAMKQYYDAVKSVNGTFISIWHNSFLGTEKRFAGWREAYEQFITGI